jgi:deoxycytidylate deaminase
MVLDDLDIRDLLWRAYRLARRHSTDRSTHNGAILTDESGDLRTLAAGWNSHLPGWGDKEEHHERPLKYSLTEHAERAALYDAARKHVRTKGLTMIANWVACPDCARGIVLAGIRRVICHKQCMDRTPSRWKEMVDLGLEMMEKNGVEVIQWDGLVESVFNLNNGEVWSP